MGFPRPGTTRTSAAIPRAATRIKCKLRTGRNFLSAKDAGQRIKKKKIDWDPKAYPVLTWRWRLLKAPAGTDQIAAIYASLDTDLMFIPVFTKYIWSGTKPEGTLTEGGMFSGSEIVVQSGAQRRRPVV